MPPVTRARGPHSALRAVAAFEALKGLLVLASAAGLLSLLHKDLHALAVGLAHHSHLNPASHYPRIFIEAAGHLQNSRLLMLALGAAAYAAIRLAEAWGLWHERAWAEVLAAASGGLYVPFEIRHLMLHPTGLSAALLVINVLIVGVMVRALVLRRRGRFA